MVGRGAAHNVPLPSSYTQPRCAVNTTRTRREAHEHIPNFWRWLRPLPIGHGKSLTWCSIMAIAGIDMSCAIRYIMLTEERKKIWLFQKLSARIFIAGLVADVSVRCPAANMGTDAVRVASLRHIGMPITKLLVVRAH